MASKRKRKKKEVEHVLKYRLSDLLRAVASDPTVSPMRRENAYKVLAYIQKVPGKTFAERLDKYRKEIPLALGAFGPFHGMGASPTQGFSVLDIEARGCELAKKYGVRRVDVLATE